MTLTSGRLLPSLFCLALALPAAQAADAVATLAHPGLPGRLLVAPDGSAGIACWLAPPGSTEPLPGDAPRLSWLEPGVRIVKAERQVQGLVLTSLVGAKGHGRFSDESLWLLEVVRLRNDTRGKWQGRLCLGIRSQGPGELRVGDDGVLLAGANVAALVSAGPDQTTLPQGPGEAILAFDIDLAPAGRSELLVARPAEPARYDSREVLDVRNLDPEYMLDQIADAWRTRVVPETLTLGSRLVTQAYHAAVGTLLLCRPQPGDAAALAEWVAALSRCRQGPAASKAVEELLVGQQADGWFSGVTSPGVQADLVRALAEHALYADDPERWARVLWRPLSRAVAALDPAVAVEPQVTSALRRAGDVADLIGETERASEWRERAGTGLPDVPPDWEATETRLAQAPLPGVVMSGDNEDWRAAAALVSLVAGSLVRSDGGAVHLFPSLPARWLDAGLLVKLADLPSGRGPVSLEARNESGRPGGEVAVTGLRLPQAAKGLRLSPPAGMAVGGVRANGRALTGEALAAGPPWNLGVKTGSLSLTPKDQPDRPWETNPAP